MNKNVKNGMSIYSSNGDRINNVKKKHDNGKGGKLIYVYQEDIEKFEKMVDEYAYLKIKISRLENENEILKNGIMRIKDIVISKNKKKM